jgi:hypothetical protein
VLLTAVPADRPKFKEQQPSAWPFLISECGRSPSRIGIERRLTTRPKVAYTFDFITDRGGVGHFELHLCGDDGEALSQAQRALSRSSTAVAVDVWNGAGRVGRIDGAPAA